MKTGVKTGVKTAARTGAESVLESRRKSVPGTPQRFQRQMCHTGMKRSLAIPVHARSGVAQLSIAAVALVTLAVTPAAAQRSSTKGWVGMSVIQNGRGDNASGVSMEYPIIASVEPGSPAQAAGLVAGDTILAYNDVDAHAEPLGMQRFLTPGQRMVVKIRRNGVRALALTVAQRSARNAYRMNITLATNGAEPHPLGPLPVAAPLQQRGADAFAGAQLARLNAGLANVLNVRDMGVLVLDVIAGTPAMRSGLQPGDVIVKADTTAVLGPVDLMEALRESPDHTVALEVLRKGKPQTVTLRW